MQKLIKIKSNELKPRGGRVLIAEPLLDEFYFGRSVVLLIEHNEEGSFGLLMNKPSGMMLNELVSDMPEFRSVVMHGGPVQTDNLYFVHTLGNEVPDSVEIVRGLYWGGDLETIKEMMLLGLVNDSQLRFFLGYSGWAPGQLEQELKRNSWVVSETSVRSLIHIKPERMWQHFLQRMGPAYDLWRSFPTDPQLN
ncbi:MAG TPA: YqgE/AlgH family protein [Bacteroidales bacterium]|nr:YqgE/AlgH family protein [Bacteroidales bacterium]